MSAREALRAERARLDELEAALDEADKAKADLARVLRWLDQNATCATHHVAAHDEWVVSWSISRVHRAIDDAEPARWLSEYVASQVL